MIRGFGHPPVESDGFVTLPKPASIGWSEIPLIEIGRALGVASEASAASSDQRAGVSSLNPTGPSPRGDGPSLGDA